MYKVWFSDLLLFARVGVTEAEREVGSRLRLSVEISVEKAPPTDDSVHQIVDYSKLIQAAREAVESAPAKTLEAVAARLAHTIFGSYAQVSFVQVSLAKLPPPTVDIVGAAGVTCGFSRP